MSGDPDLLIRLKPAWATCLKNYEDGSDWLATPPLPSGDRVDPYVLTVRMDDVYLVVGERLAGDRLPPACPELHVNGDGTFCLGRWAFRADDPVRVAAFWQSLGEYLVNQHHAERRGFWPGGRWLSHGPRAADAQLFAEQAAEDAGIGEEYAAWLETGEGWLAGPLPVDPRTGALRLRGAACPRSCKTREGGIIPVRNCRHRNAMEQLMQAETLRQLGEKRFFAMLRANGRSCCGRIQTCPLKEKQAA